MLGQIISLALDIGIGLVAFRQAYRANSREDKSEIRLGLIETRLVRLEDKGK